MSTGRFIKQRDWDVARAGRTVLGCTKGWDAPYPGLGSSEHSENVSLHIPIGFRLFLETYAICDFAASEHCGSTRKAS